MEKEVYANKGIPGWMTNECLAWLKNLGKNARLGAEAGCWLGRSTKALASGLRKDGKLYAIDTWAGVPDDPKQHDQYFKHKVDTVFRDFLENVKEETLGGRITPLRMTSVEGARQILDLHGSHCLDFVFIDADHRYEAVLLDIAVYRPLVKRGGILAGHDFKLEGVAKAVKESLPRFKHGPGSIWFQTL